MAVAINIILADDHEIFRDGFAVLFKNSNEIKLVAEARNGAHLVTLVEKHRPDVILTDIQMPEMDGLEATRIISDKFPGVGIIALTMFNDDQVIIDMLEAGAKGYLLKNTTQQELVEAIKAVHNGGTHFCHSTSEKLKNMIVQSKFNPYKLQPKAQLTPREIEVMRLICQQMKNTDIADKMCISVRTVEGYREKIFEKTGSKTLAGITIYAIKNGYYEV